jgi:hypothetical protein
VRNARNPKSIAELKNAVDAGYAVYWINSGYTVTRDSLGQYHITFKRNGSSIGLTNRAGTRLNGRLCDFVISEPNGVAP